MFKYTKILSRYILLIIGVLLLIGIFGCNKENRCNRIKARHPECFKTELVPIEIIRNDTIYRTYEKVDTLFFMDPNNAIDTFIMITPKVTTTIIRVHDTLVVTNEVKPDTIIKTVIQTVREFKNPVANTWWFKLTNRLPQIFNWIIFIFITLTIAAFLIKVKKWLKI